MARILLLGMDSTSAEKVKEILNQSHHTVNVAPTMNGLDLDQRVDVVFASADAAGYSETLGRIRSRPNAPPVIVVTGEADSSEWLDALDAGASDYCSSPFDAVQLRWIVESVLSPALTRKQAAVAAS